MLRRLWTSNQRHITKGKDTNHGGEGAKEGTNDP